MEILSQMRPILTCLPCWHRYEPTRTCAGATRESLAPLWDHPPHPRWISRTEFPNDDRIGLRVLKLLSAVGS